MGHRVAADGAAVFHHFLDHGCGQRLATAIDVILVEIERERISELFEDGKRVGVSGFPAVIDGDDHGLFRDLFLAVLPRDEIRHRDHWDAELADRLHLLAEFRGADAHGGLALGFGKIMVSEHRDADAVVRHVEFAQGLGVGSRVLPHERGNHRQSREK